MSQYEVDFNIENFGNDENDIQYLKIAIDNLTSESEKQFQTIKNEKWFTRIIDLATLSNKKNIQMSKQISNIAQAQDILIELLKRLSATDVKIDNMLLNSMDQIEQLYSHSEKLALKVLDLKEQMIYGINQSKNINDFKDIEKKVLYNLLQEASKTFELTSVEQQQFADNLFRYLQIEHSTLNLADSINQLDSVAIKKVLLQLLLEYGFLNNRTFNFNRNFEEIVEMFDFGDKTINQIKDTIKNIFQLRGVDGFSWFNPVILEHDFFIDLEIEEYLDQESGDFKEKEPFTLEPIIVVNQNETEVIKNKIINLSSIITVKGKLKFENCEINIFDNFVPLVLQTGVLEFLECQINAINEKDSIIVKSEDDSYLNIYNSSIKTNIPLFEANKGNAKVQDSFIDSQHRKLLNCKNINVINSELINSKRNKLIGKHNGDNFLSVFAGNLKIENSVFKNLKNIFGGYESPYVIENSKFEDFCDLGDLHYLDNGGKITNTIINQIDEYLGLSNVAIENCEIKDGKFRDYEDLASNYFIMEIDNSNIKNLKLDNLEFVQFKECSLTNIKATNVADIALYENNEFIESSFDQCYFRKIINQGNKFFNSTFSNATIKNPKFSIKNQGFLDFTISKSDYMDTKIEGCLFKNINVEDSYIINLNCHERIKYNRHEISNCIFKDCNSENSSFINLESFYFPKFSKKRKDIVLGVERDNIGVENLKN
ncbi:hypothetical protein [Staphylococcus chromogenes]|uniref:hypothetical protein n=1 Tax=Staphylococcus chromogenes TaxID=46126 RepID=UPI0028842F04|nr:hypothetical protein [Staphylococcus chromogenes]MDT0672175.1 hypothetical protein [Staphylococcus chromogenes]MDT0674251.1 hypothetical protein [Staphylococcus chromogenes]